MIILSHDLCHVRYPSNLKRGFKKGTNKGEVGLYPQEDFMAGLASQANSNLYAGTIMVRCRFHIILNFDTILMFNPIQTGANTRGNIIHQQEVESADSICESTQRGAAEKVMNIFFSKYICMYVS